jgi:hypothetical protein
MDGNLGFRDQPDDDTVVSIFKTEDPGVLPLATMALDAEGIAYAVRSAGKADTLQWTISQKPTNRPVVMEIVVARDVAFKARDLVVDLEQPLGSSSGLAAADPSVLAAVTESPAAIRLEDAATGIAIGAITEEQLQKLTSHLEEEAPQQFFVNAATVEMLEGAHADAALVDLLRQAVGGGDGRAIRWTI